MRNKGSLSPWKRRRAESNDESYRRCRANGGALGIDGISFDKIEAPGRKQWLEGIMQELRSGAYRPQPLLRVWIPKSNGGQRPLGIPPIALPGSGCISGARSTTKARSSTCSFSVGAIRRRHSG